MPKLNANLDHEVLGREYKKGELNILRRQIEKRFGPLPKQAEDRLSKLTAAELEDLGVRVLDAKALDELFQYRAAGRSVIAPRRMISTQHIPTAVLHFFQRQDFNRLGSRFPEIGVLDLGTKRNEAP